MAKPIKPRNYDVYITKHGYERYCERMKLLRFDPLTLKKLRRQIRDNLNDKIVKGVKLETRITVNLQMDAVLMFSGDQWNVVTFLFRRRRLDLKLGA
ncbi:MAG: hypothetical protein FH756_06020 [Firmicutes bacterium]|nr:hypothetical protein [Bacillota bacterium]